MSNASAQRRVPPLQVPSRRDNPFATCWTKPGALAYRFSQGESAEHLVDELARRSWCGAIVGPHGSGKSTLLETLRPVLAEASGQFISVSLHDGERCLPSSVWHDLKSPSEPQSSLAKPRRLLIIDGYEQLSWLERWRIARHCRTHDVGVLVTSHSAVHVPVRIPTLLTTAPDRVLVAQLVGDLANEVSTPITPEDIDASHACHGSNVREIFFDLYDRHEQRRR